MTKTTKNKFLLALSAVGPGLFLIGYNIGTGSVTTMAKAGAEHGMTLLWAVILSCIFTYILMVAYGQATLVTGKTALFNLKTRVRGGKWLAIYVMVALIIGELFALIGIMGIVADLVQEGIRLLTDGTMIKTGWIILTIVVIMAFLFWNGRYKVFEKVQSIFVLIMVSCFCVVLFMVSPSLSSIFGGVVLTIPNVPCAFGLVAAMAGSTNSATVFIVRCTVVIEKRWTIDNQKGEKKDAFV